METWKQKDLNGKSWISWVCCALEDEGEEREEEKEAKNESEEAAATREGVVAVIPMEKPFFLDDIDLIPWLGEAVIMVVVVLVALCGGGGRVRRGSNRGGVEGSSDGFLTIVRVP